MPIYAYRCDDCGLAKDVLQKMSDDVLTVCPECGKSNFKKQITAAGFQLKGSGWYVTDFREGNKPASGANNKVNANNESDSSASANKSAETTQAKQTTTSESTSNTSNTTNTTNSASTTSSTSSASTTSSSNKSV